MIWGSRRVKPFTSLSSAQALHAKLVDAMRSQPRGGDFEPWSLGGSAPDLTDTVLKVAAGDATKLMDSLKILKQYDQLLSEACTDPFSQLGRFLHGHVDSCVNGLEWFRPLCCPMRPVDERSVGSVLSMHQGRFPSAVEPGELAFSMLKTASTKDVDLSRFMLKSAFPSRNTQEYEIPIVHQILTMHPEADWDEFKMHFIGWRDSGLTHVLWLAASCAPELDHWLPKELQSSSSAQLHLKPALQILNQAVGLNSAEIHSVLSNFAAQDPKQYSTTWVAGQLDRLAVLMRVKSNFGGELGCYSDLDVCLQDWGGDEKFHIQSFWLNTLCKLQQCMPPSVLCPTLASSVKKPTWGHATLSYELVNGDCLRIKERRLGWIDRVGKNAWGLTSAASKGEDVVSPIRLQDVIMRTGTLLLSPEIVHAMLYPASALGFLEDSDDPLTPMMQQNVANKNLILSIMRQPEEFDLADRVEVDEYLDALHGMLPPVLKINYRSPHRLIAWRVDPPPRVITLADDIEHESVSPHNFFPHKLDKSLLDERSSVKRIGRIHVSDQECVGADAFRQDIIRSILQHVDYCPLPDHESLSKGRVRPHTALAEGLACITLQTPKMHTTATLGEVVPWMENYEDSRYAETQQAANGVRYRDWVCVYADDHSNHKVRLEGHVFTVDKLYTTYFPWRREGGQQWVAVHSTLPTETRVLHDQLQPEQAYLRDDSKEGQTKALLNSVKARLLQDLRLLPVPDPERHEVDRSNPTLYTDVEAGQVMIVYAPNGSDKLEMMAFGLVQ